jgi:hypothetical protein
MSSYNPNRELAGKSTGGQFTAKVNGEQEIDLPPDEIEAPIRPRQRLTSFGLTMLKVSAENYTGAGEEVPADLTETIRQAEEDIAQYEAEQRARTAPASIQPEPVVQAKPEPVYDLSTDEGRFQAAKAEEVKMDELLAISNAATTAVNKADANIRELRRESYKGISFDVERMREQAQPLRDTARETHQAYLNQSKVWNDARDYAVKKMSAAGLDRVAQLKAARTTVVDAKGRLAILINGGGSVEEKDIARNEWHAAIVAEQKLKGLQ